jgi:hypothetical protein
MSPHESRRQHPPSCRDLLSRSMAGDYFNPPQTRRRQHCLGVITTVNITVKTMPAHGPAS